MFGKLMLRSLIFSILLCLSGAVFACADKQSTPSPSVDDVVFNNITPQSEELDRKLQSLYECKYAFAMTFSSSSYESMLLISGSMPATPEGSDGKPLVGLVLVGFVLNADGTPIDPVLLTESDESLSRIALDNVLGLRYRPSKFNGKVVRALGIQVYDFK